MTNRTIGTPSSPYVSGFYLTQTGTNGSTEVVDGVERTKWNPYTKYQQERSIKASPNGNTPGLGVPTTLTNGILDARILGKLDDKIKGSSFNLGMTLGESRQTFHMIRDNILSIGGALIDVKHGRLAQAARRLGVSSSVVNGYTRTRVNLRTGPDKLYVRDLSKRWLELQYGWMPLVNDIYEGGKLIEKITNQPRVDWIYAKVSNDRRGDASQSPTLYSCPYLIKDGRKVIYERREYLSVERQLGLKDPLAIAWELMPWSFVIDWVIPIGTYLQAYAAIPKLVGRHCLTKYSFGETGAFTHIHPAFKGASGFVRQVNVSRTVGTGAEAFTVPRPEFKQLDQVFSGLHIMNAIALVQSRLSKPHSVPVI